MLAPQENDSFRDTLSPPLSPEKKWLQESLGDLPSLGNASHGVFISTSAGIQLSPFHLPQHESLSSTQVSTSLCMFYLNLGFSLGYWHLGQLSLCLEVCCKLCGRTPWLSSLVTCGIPIVITERHCPVLPTLVGLVWLKLIA